MEPHYNAFISYRHHPEDIKVATQIHKLLERLQVPKALKKQNKGITKLFRDKDELPLTSDLTESITVALRNSEFLIVICSVHTKESLWVQREIDVFLQTHSRSQILTVLVNGEPYEVIPETLLYEDVVDPVTGTITREALEPLSCDWRMPLHKARKEELPRLAAALLHCSYDELRQRQKQYRMQKLLIGGSVAMAASLALAAYFLYTSITIRDANIRIQENYIQALKNQSQYLTTAAQERMEAGDHLTALRLLQEALPNEENQRPYVADAERVLADALGVYSNDNGIVARGALTPDETSVVTDFLLTGDGNHIYLLDSRNIVTVWNTQTLLQEATIDSGMEDCELFAVTSAGDLLLHAYYGDGNNFTECHRLDGTLRWRVEGYMENVAFQGDREILLGQISTGEGEDLLLFLDPATGEQIKEPVILTSENGSSQTYRFTQQQFKWGDPLILSYNAGRDWRDYKTHIYLLNPDTGLQKLLLVSKYSPNAAYTTEDGKVILMISDGSGQLNGSAYDIITTSPAKHVLYCYDQVTGAELWQSEILTTQYSVTYTLLPVPDSEMVFCQAGNTFQLINTADGQVLQHCEVPNPACCISEVTAKDAYGILMDGGICTYYFQDNLCETEYSGIPSNLRHAEIVNNFCALPMQDSQVTVYHRQSTDILWKADLSLPVVEWNTPERAENLESIMDQTDALGANAGNIPIEELIAQMEALVQQLNALSEGEIFPVGDWLVVDDRKAIELYDLKKQTWVWTQPRPISCTILGCSDDLSTLWTAEGIYNLTSYHTATGEKHTYAIPKRMNDNYLDLEGKHYLCNDRIWYLLSQDQTLYLADLTPETGEVTYRPFLSTGVEVPAELAGCAGNQEALKLLLENKEFSKEVEQQAYVLMESCDAFAEMKEGARILSITADNAWLLSGTGSLYVLPLEGGKPRLVEETLADPLPIAHRASDGITAIPGKNGILLCSPEGQIVQELDLGRDRVGILYFRGDELLCQTALGFLLRFSPDWTLLSRVEMFVSDEYHTELAESKHLPSDVTWHETEDGKLICYAYGAANIIDCETWASCGSLLCDSYYPCGNAFLRRKSGTLEAIQRYTLEELLQIAQEQLGDFQLTEQEKEAYGLS